MKKRFLLYLTIVIVLIAVGIIYVHPLIVDPISNPRLDSASAEERVLYVIFDQMVYSTMEEPRKMMIDNLGMR